MQITGEIQQVGGGKLTAPEDAARYLRNFNGQAVLVFWLPIGRLGTRAIKPRCWLRGI
jgi:hypothetical protein